MGAIYGNSYYTLVEAPDLSWDRARTSAKGYGGDLVVIETSDENDYLFSYYRSALNSHSGEINPTNIGGIYIGLTDENSEGTWQWVNGTSTSLYSNFRRDSSDSSYANHVELWIKDTHTPSGESRWGVTRGTYQAIAEIPLSYFSISDAKFREGKGGEITITRTGGTTTTQTLKVKSSDGTATIADDDYAAVDKTITFAKGETSKTISVSTTADLDVESDESFSLTMTAEGSDNVPPQITDGSATVTIKADDFKRGDSLYTIVDGPSWTQAETEAKRLGGNLVTINDSTENSWLTNRFEDGLRRYYIGLNDKKRNQTYEWISGQISNYRNWFPYGEPNGNTSADVVELVPNEAQGRFKGGWNDLPDNSLDIFGSWNSTSGIAEIPLGGTSTYSISTSTSSIDEKSQSSVRFNISTTDVDANTRLYYTLSGSGVTASDFSSGDIKSSRLIGSDGKATFVLSAAADKTTESNESFTIKLYTDWKRNEDSLVATSDPITIRDTSTTPTPTYSISSSPSPVNEEGSLTTNISTTNVTSGTTLYYSLTGTGVNSDDFSSGGIQGSTKVDASGKSSFSLTTAADKTTEGNESFTIKLYTDESRSELVASSDAITINDTSTTPVKPTYSLSLTPSSIDEGDSFRASITTTNVKVGTKLYYDIKGSVITDDFTGNSGLASNVSVDSSGTASFTLKVAADKLTEGTETAHVLLYSDQERTIRVARPEEVEISDTSTTPAKSSYSISLKPSNLKEGDILTSNVSTKNVDPGTRLYWSFTGSGINSSDFSSGSIQGSSAIDKSGEFSLTHAIAEDKTTEGSESLKLQLFSDANRKSLLTQESLTIRDSSTTPQSANLTDASVKANLLTLSFDGSLASTTPDTARFSLQAAGSSVGIDSAEVNANAGTVELSLDASIKPNQPVRLSYSDLSGDQSTGVLQTPDGTDVDSFSTAVTNTNKDTQPPKLNSAFINAKSLTLSFSEAISSSVATNRSWTVKENGSAIPVLSSNLDSANAQLDLQLSKPVDAGSSITLSYSDLAGNQSSNVIEDLAGNDLASISNLAVENRTKRSDKPLNINTAEVDADEIVLAFDRELDSTTPSKGTFRLTANGKAIKVKSINLNAVDREATIILKSAVEHGDSVVLSYTDAEGNQKKNVIQDIDGNDLDSISSLPLTNNTRKESKDFFVNYADADGSTINLYLTDTLSDSIPKASRFRITANKRRQLISSVFTDPSDGVVTLNLKKPLDTNQDVLISYMDLNGDQSSGILEDDDGNDLASFTNLAPLNDTTDNDPPILQDAYVDGKELILEFDELLTSGKIKNSRFKVRADKKRILVTSASIPADDSIAILELKSIVPSSTKDLSLTYRSLKGDQSAGIIQDMNGNDLKSLRNFPVEII